MANDEDEEGEEEEHPAMAWSGEVVDHIPHGQGVATYTNGDSYEGSFDMGKKQGCGLYKFSNGATYQGEYLDNVRSGRGVITYPDKSSYNGFRAYIHSEADRMIQSGCVGSWKGGKKDGFGTYNYSSGDIYRGGWLEDRRHGKGTYYFKESMSQFCGAWMLGSFDNGEWIHRDGNIYQGNFVVNQPHGEGIFKFFKQNNLLHGEYVDQKWSSGQLVSLP